MYSWQSRMMRGFDDRSERWADELRTIVWTVQIALGRKPEGRQAEGEHSAIARTVMLELIIAPIKVFIRPPRHFLKPSGVVLFYLRLCASAETLCDH